MLDKLINKLREQQLNPRKKTPHLYHPYGFNIDWGFGGQFVVADLVEGS